MFSLLFNHILKRKEKKRKYDNELSLESLKFVAQYHIFIHCKADDKIRLEKIYNISRNYYILIISHGRTFNSFFCISD